MSQLNQSVFNFLNDLKKNNNREWFADHKDQYVGVHEQVIFFADSLLTEMKTHDEIATISGKKSLFRIYRDVRFSKDKSPYKNHFSGSMQRASKWLRGGYYFHLEPDNVFIAAGFFSPSKEDLQRIREELVADEQPLRQILNDSSFKRTFGNLEGEQLKTAPKGFDKEHSAIDLIRFKQFYFTHKYANKEVQDSNFSKRISDDFKKIRPYLDYMTEVLTTDANGLPIE